MSDPWRDSEVPNDIAADIDDKDQSIVKRLLYSMLGLVTILFGVIIILVQIASVPKKYQGVINSFNTHDGFQIGLASGAFIWAVPLVMLGWYLAERGGRLIGGKSWAKDYKSGPSYFFDIKFPLIGMTIMTVLMAIWSLVGSNA